MSFTCISVASYLGHLSHFYLSFEYLRIRRESRDLQSGDSLLRTFAICPVSIRVTPLIHAIYAWSTGYRAQGISWVKGLVWNLHSLPFLPLSPPERKFQNKNSKGFDSRNTSTPVHGRAAPVNRHKHSELQCRVKYCAEFGDNCLQVRGPRVTKCPYEWNFVRKTLGPFSSPPVRFTGNATGRGQDRDVQITTYTFPIE